MNTNEEIKPEELDVTLPSDILNQNEEDDDSDMPKPETADYGRANQNDNRKLIPTPKFYMLVGSCLGKLPYATILKNTNNDQIKLTDLLKFIESKPEMTVTEMNTIISFIATTPLDYIKPFMELVESRDRQQELWRLAN